MYPHERSLVQKWKDHPFALIGVNSDADLTYVKARVRQEQIHWRSFWNGPLGTSGPISSRWGVRSWPTLFVLDHEGVIQSIDSRGEELDELLATLIEQAR